MNLRAGLDYNEEVHRLVKNFSPRQGFLRTVGTYGGQDGKRFFLNKNKNKNRQPLIGAL